MVEWGDWKLIIGSREYPTPYANKDEWRESMEEKEAKDSARLIQKKLEERFSGGVYDELKQILGQSVTSDDAASISVYEQVRKKLSQDNPMGDYHWPDPVSLADKVIESINNKTKEVK